MLHRRNETFNRYFDAYNVDFCSMLLTAHMQGLVKPAISFLVQRKKKNQELQKKKRIIQRNISLRTITPRSNPLCMYSQIRPNPLLCYLSTCYRRHLSTIDMIACSMIPTKVGTGKEDGVWFPYFARFLLDFLSQKLWVGHHTFLKYIHPEDTNNFYCLVQ